MKVRIVGAGAVGAVVAWKLYKHTDTAFIVDEERLKRYSEGLVVNGERISFSLIDSGHADKADLLIFAVKNMQLEDAIDESRPFVSDSTVIMSLLNGIEAEEKLSKAFGEDKVLYAFITDLSSNHEGIETTCFSGGGTIVYGDFQALYRNLSAVSRFADHHTGYGYAAIPAAIRHIHVGHARKCHENHGRKARQIYQQSFHIIPNVRAIIPNVRGAANPQPPSPD